MPDTAPAGAAPVVLGLDTSAAHCAAAVVSGGRVLASRTEPMTRGQAERLFPLIEQVLDEAGVGWQGLSAIGVGVGPGNFTGVRISVAAARGLALSLGIAAHGVSVTEAAAHGVPRPCRAVVPLRGDEVAWQDFADELAGGLPAGKCASDDAAGCEHPAHEPVVAEWPARADTAADTPVLPPAPGSGGLTDRAAAQGAADLGPAQSPAAPPGTALRGAALPGAASLGEALPPGHVSGSDDTAADTGRAAASERGSRGGPAARALTDAAPAGSIPDVARWVAPDDHRAQSLGPALAKSGELPDGPAPLVPVWSLAEAVALVAESRFTHGAAADRPAPLYLRPADAAPPREPAPAILP